MPLCGLNYSSLWYNTILKTNYQSIQETKNDLSKFLSFHDLYRRHGSLRKGFNVKTTFEAIEKWYQLKPELFKINPTQFKNNVLTLNPNSNQPTLTTLSNLTINKEILSLLVRVNTKTLNFRSHICLKKKPAKILAGSLS